jgi:hypothetical protein
LAGSETKSPGAVCAALLALALAACSDEPVLAQKAGPPPTLPASCDDPAAVVTLRTTANQPTWLLFARQAGGGEIQFNRHSIRRCGANEAQIDIRVRYDQAQLYATEDARYETTIRYNVEEVSYRFRCTDQTFAVLERRIIGDQDRVVSTIPGRPELFRPAVETGVAGRIIRTACLGR